MFLCLTTYATGKLEQMQLLRTFPMVVDTEALQRRKTALERAIDETDKSITVFERPRVYVAP